MHLAVGLIKAGRRVATLDIDFEGRTLSQYIHNRLGFAQANELALDTPAHYRVTDALSNTKSGETETAEINFISSAIAAAESDHDFIIIDTPSVLTKSNLFAHALADTVISPINDSFLDLDAIVPSTEMTQEIARSAYTAAIHRAREARELVTSRTIEWLVIPNRVFSSLDTRNERTIRMAIEEASLRLGFRIAPGIAELLVYRQLFPKGLTAFDPMEESLLGVKPGISHVLARQDLRQLTSLVNFTPDRESDEWRMDPKVTHLGQPHASGHSAAAE
jgi:chromosome partitioning protein